mgnify:CR=1 FL=1
MLIDFCMVFGRVLGAILAPKMTLFGVTLGVSAACVCSCVVGFDVSQLFFLFPWFAPCARKGRTSRSHRKNQWLSSSFQLPPSRRRAPRQAESQRHHVQKHYQKRLENSSKLIRCSSPVALPETTPQLVRERGPEYIRKAKQASKASKASKQSKQAKQASNVRERGPKPSKLSKLSKTRRLDYLKSAPGAANRGKGAPRGIWLKSPAVGGAPRKIKIKITIMAAAARPENRPIPSIALPGARLRS